MRSDEGRKVTPRLADLEVHTPSATEALARNFCYQFISNFDPEDAAQMAAALKAKANGGDIDAIALTLKVFEKFSGVGRPGAKGADLPSLPAPGPSLLPVVEIRQRLVGVICSEGPLHADELALRVCQPMEYVVQALGHPWFEREADGWHATSKGRSDNPQPKPIHIGRQAAAPNGTPAGGAK